METATRKQSISFAESIFKRLGLIKCVQSIYDEIEEEFAGSYSRTNDYDDDCSTAATYGGTLTDTYTIIESGKCCYTIRSKLSLQEQQMLRILAQKKTFDISVERADRFGQLWSIEFSLPLVPNKHNGDMLTLSYLLKISTQGKLVSFKASSNRELDEAQLERLIFLHSMKC
jgi:hypothetical protein